MATGVVLTTNPESTKLDPSLLARSLGAVAIIASVVRSLVVGDYDFGSASALGIGIGLLGMAQYPVFAARASNYLTIVAVVSLSGKLLGCTSCRTNALPQELSITVTTLAIAFVSYLAVVRRPQLEGVRQVLIALALLGQITLTCSFNMLCAPCLVTTLVIGGALFPAHGNIFSSNLLKGALAACVLVAGISLVRALVMPLTSTSRLGKELDRSVLFRNDESLSGIIMVSSPDCPACSAAEPFVRGEKPSWTILDPCEDDATEPCWNRTKEALPTPTLLRLKGDKAMIVSIGFDHKAWRDIK